VFADKASGARRGSVRGDLLIGADGIHSTVRARLYPGEGPPSFSGIMMWRGIVESEPFLDGRTMIIAGNWNQEAVVYPVSHEAAQRGRSLINWVAVLRIGGEQPRREDWSRQGRIEDFLPRFANWKFGFIDLPALFRMTEHILEYPMVDRDPLDRWSFGRVTLLGDAAHPMYPNGSNGAAQAILDAEALAAALHEGATWPRRWRATKRSAGRRPLRWFSAPASSAPSACCRSSMSVSGGPRTISPPSSHATSSRTSRAATVASPASTSRPSTGSPARVISTAKQQHDRLLLSYFA
jgi:2-polyprenyl-6-methoxyphenol hydroxylase-like FAD-dependent oxidoreductase